MCYAIKYAGKDFSFLENNENIKGTRKKRRVQDTSNQFVIFKYEQPDYCCSEACSEKLCYEIAVCLKYPCARIEVAKDENGILGVLNYDFILTPLTEHTDIVAFLNPTHLSRGEFYTISNIKKNLDSLNKNLFLHF